MGKKTGIKDGDLGTILQNPGNCFMFVKFDGMVNPRTVHWGNVEVDLAEIENQVFRILYFGNPGGGKSTLANCIARQKLFRAGAGHGEGLTKEMEVCRDARGRLHVDLLGISDVRNRQEAARETTKALKEGGLCKIVMVFLEHHCRARAEDRTTMKLILKAAPEMAENYAVIVNQCGPAIMQRLSNTEWKKQFESILFQDVPQITNHVHYVPRIDELDGKEDVIYEFDDKFHKFIEEA